MYFVLVCVHMCVCGGVCVRFRKSIIIIPTHLLILVFLFFSSEKGNIIFTFYFFSFWDSTVLISWKDTKLQTCEDHSKSYFMSRY